MLKEIINNWKSYCIAGNFIGIGSTRKVYRVSDLVIKVNVHPIGHKQSQTELSIYKAMVEQGHHDLFAEVFYVNEQIAIQKYYQPMELRDGQSYEISKEIDRSIIPDKYEEVIRLLDAEFDSFDLKDSGNYGLDGEHKLIFIDYGMTKKLYEDEWVPQAEAGVLPQIYFEKCKECGKEKELRIYGDDDSDKRCYACGKE